MGLKVVGQALGSGDARTIDVLNGVTFSNAGGAATGTGYRAVIPQQFDALVGPYQTYIGSISGTATPVYSTNAGLEGYIGFPFLKITDSGVIECINNAGLYYLDLQGLERLTNGTTLNFSGCTGLYNTTSLPGVTDILPRLKSFDGCTISFENCGLPSFELPAFEGTVINGTISLASNASITTIPSFIQNATVISTLCNVSLSGCGLTGAQSFTALTEIANGAYLDLSSNSSITQASFPALTTLQGTLNLNGHGISDADQQALIISLADTLVSASPVTVDIAGGAALDSTQVNEELDTLEALGLTINYSGNMLDFRGYAALNGITVSAASSSLGWANFWGVTIIFNSTSIDAHTNSITILEFPDLIEILSSSYVNFGANPIGTCTAPNLTTLNGYLGLNNTDLTTFSLPALTGMSAGQLYLQSCASLTGFGAESLTSITSGYIDLRYCSALNTLSLIGLETLDSAYIDVRDTNMTSLDFPALATITGSGWSHGIFFTNNSTVTQLTLPALDYLGCNEAFQYLDVCDVSALATIENAFVFFDHFTGTSFDLGALASMTWSNLTVSYCPNLPTISLPSLTTLDNSNITFTYNDLDDAAQQALLAQLADNLVTVTGSCTIDIQNNAQPLDDTGSGAGPDLATLAGLGITVLYT